MKYKILDKENIKINIDRLTRFKPVQSRYERVFEDIITKHLISKDKKIVDMELNEKAEIASLIFNTSLKRKSEFHLNEIIKKDEEAVFYLSFEDKICLNSNFDFEAALDLFDLNELPPNLQRLKLQKNLTSTETRQKYSTLFPISKVILVEGITEEILLIEFAKVLGLDFKKEGIFVLGAGGKNQVARKYYKMSEEIKIPIFVLLDLDADETYQTIYSKLRKIDELYKIKSGEFEDILSKNLIKNALNKHFSQIMGDFENSFEDDKSRHAVSNLNNCYKNNGWGEFKKADFARIVKEYLTDAKNPPLSDELKIIIEKIKKL